MDAVATELKAWRRRSNPRPDSSHSVVAGRYELDPTDPIAVGGMAVVFRGRDLRTRRDVALKTLRPEYRTDPETRARFRREIRTMTFAAHPNVAEIYDLQEEPDAPWAVMELVPGKNLKQILNAKGPFDAEDTANILDQVASALDHLHARGFVHLDIKPQNIMMLPDGTIKLIDFGLAQPAGHTQQLISGTTFGTAAYLAPEQAAGEPVDATTDVYALGCVVYELLTGNPPFHDQIKGDAKHELIRAHIERDPPPPSKVRPDLHLPGWVDDVVLWAMSRHPTERYHTVSSFARVFHDGAFDELTTTRQIAPRELDDLPLAPIAEPAHPAGRVARAVYQAGGRAARRGRRFSRTLWRLTAAFAVVNLILFLVSFAIGHVDAGIIGGEASLHAGGTARVSVDSLNVRQTAGQDAAIVATLAYGTDLALTGSPERLSDGAWWPIELTVDGTTIDGYVWQGGIAPIDKGRFAFVHDTIGRGKEAARLVGDGIDAVRGAIGQ